MTARRALGFCPALLLLLCLPAYAHVGSKDVFEQVTAGPYKLYVTIRPPTIIPGVATVEVRSYGAPVTSLTDTPMLLTGEASKHPPTPDGMQQSANDPQFFTGQLWIMAQGSWQVRFGVTGAAGTQTAAVPVPAAATQMLTMTRGMGLMLAALGLLLIVGVAAIVAAAVRQARLRPGEHADDSRRKRALLAGAAAFAVMLFAAYWGNRWWNVEAAEYAGDLYRPDDLHASLAGAHLQLALGKYDEEAKQWELDRKLVLLPDHGHPMHLYAIRWPQMDAVYHLHPTETAQAQLQTSLPAMVPGNYHLFADIVRKSGFPETLTTTLHVPETMGGGTLDSEDAAGTPPALNVGLLGARYTLPDGYTMLWDKPASLSANSAAVFRFTLLAPNGKPVTDMQPYLGMAGHAAFVKTDGTVFAHTHPDGSAAMPAMMLANASSSGQAMSDMGAASMTGMGGVSADAPGASLEKLAPTVEFPYGFPTAGRYRIFIQMKHGSTVETGVFDAQVQ